MMKNLVIDGFEMNEQHIKMLLNDLKDERVKTTDDLEGYLKDHWYTKDNARKCHLLLAKHSNRRNFAIPFDE